MTAGPEQYQDAEGNPIALETLVRREPDWAANRIRAGRSADELMQLMQLIGQCLDRDIGVQVVKCGRYAEPGKPYLCRLTRGFGTAKEDHLVYGNNAREILLDAMEHVLARGFTQPQDRYGLGLDRRPSADPADRGAAASD